MKKTILVTLLACLLLLSGCQKAPAQESATPTPTPTQDQTAETPPVSPDPEASADPDGETSLFPQFLKDLDLPLANTLLVGEYGLQYLTCSLSPEERGELKSLLDMDSWWEATDVPAMGLEADYSLYDGEGRSLTVNDWNQNKCLIIAKSDNDTYLYYAPTSVLEAFENYLSGKTFLPEFIRTFEMDQININRTPYEDREGYKDFDVYLLDDTQQLSFFWALEPDSWTAFQENELAIMYYDALTSLDGEGNRIILAPWDEEKCLVNCFYTDSYSRYGDTGTGPVARYWAPVSVLDNALDLVDQLSPLGTIDNEALRYYKLFMKDWGFDMLIRDATTRGNISDDQMAAYVFYVTDYNYEIGISPEEVDAVTQKHFGRKMGSYDTSWSNILPSGNMTPSGWDFHASCFPVLTGTSDMDEYGNISATFKVYTLWDDPWLEDNPPAPIRFPGAYLLTGNDSYYMEDQYNSCQTIDITFRIETETVYGVQKEYLVYDAVRVVD